MWTDVYGIFQKYMGTGIVVILFLAAIVYLFLTEKRKERRILLIYLPVLTLLLYFNPLFAAFFCKVVDTEIYFRICWLLPVGVVLGYSAVQIAERFEGKKQACLIAGMLCLIAISGKLVYTNPLYSRAQNPYHVPDSVVHICDAIKCEGREVMAAFPREMVLYVRQYSPYVCMPYGRDAYETEFNHFEKLMDADVIDLETMWERIELFGVHYIILDEKKEILGDPQDFNLVEFDRMDGYVIYYNNNLSLTY